MGLWLWGSWSGFWIAVSFNFIQQTPKLNSPGFFIGEKNMENKIQDKIFLAPEERVALIERKLERARVQVDAMIAQMEAVKKVKTNEQTNSWW